MAASANPHRSDLYPDVLLVVAEFEGGLVDEGASAFGAAAAVTLPAVGNARE